jgi:HTH-type transcriptional regulator/antitoxin HigA
MKKHIERDDLPELAQAWSSLQRYVPLRPIQNEEDFERVCALGDTLAETVSDDSTHPLYSLFQLTMDLIEQWEDKHVSLPEVPPREVLRYLLEANDLKQKDLVDIASPALVSDILAGRREISKKLAKALSERFHVDVSAFI